MEAPGGIEPRTVRPPLRTRLEDEGWGRSLNIRVFYSFYKFRQLLYPLSYGTIIFYLTKSTLYSFPSIVNLKVECEYTFLGLSMYITSS